MPYVCPSQKNNNNVTNTSSRYMVTFRYNVSLIFYHAYTVFAMLYPIFILNVGCSGLMLGESTNVLIEKLYFNPLLTKDAHTCTHHIVPTGPINDQRCIQNIDTFTSFPQR